MATRVPTRPTSVTVLGDQARRRWVVVYVGVIGLLLVSVAVTQVFTPADAAMVDSGALIVAVAALALAVLWVLIRPVVGVYLIVFFTLAGDSQTMRWYPFTKNFSSRESVLFLSDSIIVNPLEVMLLLTTASWLVRSLGHHHWQLVRGKLFVPLAVFAMFVFYGMVNGFGRGGDVNIGLWEARPLLYLPLFYVLVTNLFTTPKQYVRVMWLAVVAVTIQSVLSIAWFFSLSAGARESREDLTEHSSSIPIDALIILLLCVILLPRCSRGLRFFLPIAAIPSVWAYFLAERRSAFVALALGLLLFFVVLFHLNRRAFWWFVPIVTVLGAGYVAAFWGSQGSLGFPAQAVKSAIAPGKLEGKDQSSNIYRELEAINIWFTIRSSPVRGIGFGHVFYQLYPLPRLDSFIFWQFMPHHSFLWIWLKMGFAGFVSMLFLMIRALQYGARSVFRMPQGDVQAISITAVLYVPMYLVYSYVDIAWDIRSMVFLAVAMAISADLEGLVGRAPPRDAPAPVRGQLSNVGRT